MLGDQAHRGGEFCLLCLLLYPWHKAGAAGLFMGFPGESVWLKPEEVLVPGGLAHTGKTPWTHGAGEAREILVCVEVRLPPSVTAKAVGNLVVLRKVHISISCTWHQETDVPIAKDKL